MPSTILLYVSFAFYYIGVTSQNVDKPGNCQSLDGGFKSKNPKNRIILIIVIQKKQHQRLFFNY